MAQKIYLTNGSKTIEVKKNSQNHQLFLQRGFKETNEAPKKESAPKKDETTSEPEPVYNSQGDGEEDEFSNASDEDLRDFLKENGVNPGNAGRQKLLEKARNLE